MMRSAHKLTEGRLRWLEREVTAISKTDCSSIPTGTPLGPLLVSTADSASGNLPAVGARLQEHDAPNLEGPSPVQTVPRSPNVASLLALNAVGEPRFLGPSSGAFFSIYAASMVQSSAGHHMTKQRNDRIPVDQDVPTRASSSLDVESLSPYVLQVLVRSFSLWIVPWLPLLGETSLKRLIAASQSLLRLRASATPEQACDSTTLWLVLALGSVYLPSTLKQLHLSASGHNWPTPEALYAKALETFQNCSESLRSSRHLIQVLLLVACYSSHEHSDAGQWQLVGVALRVSKCSSLWFHAITRAPGRR